MVEARSLKVLRIEENRSTKEKVIRYTRKTVIGEENVDTASSWEETVQVLEVLACRGDREEIDRQVNAKLQAAETDQQKQQLYQQFMAYLNQRQTELEKEGGKDSLIYKREATIIQNAITRYKLVVADTTTAEKPEKPVDISQETPKIPQPVPPVDQTPQQSHVFCTNCGAKNPPNSKFCHKCGHQLTKNQEPRTKN